MPLASVCVATYSRPGPLAACLDRLTNLDPPDGGYEVVVVDDGSPDAVAVREVVEKAAAASPVPVRFESLPRNSGPAAARNRAWRIAGGERIAFTDDDCLPRPDWLVRLLAVDADVVQGRTVPDPSGAHLLRHPLARSLRVEAMDGFFQTANIAYRRHVLDGVGGFDESLRRTGEDTDLAVRAMADGATTAFAGDAVVEHAVVVRTWRQDLRDRRRWGGATAVIRRHPSLRRLAWKPYVYRRTHVVPLALLATTPLLATKPGRRAWLATVAAVLAGDVVKGGNPSTAKALVQRRIADGYEVGVLLAASARDRTVLL